MNRTIATAKAELFARTSTAQLAIALRTLDREASLTSDEKWARAQIIDELEGRYPAAAAAVEAAFDGAEALISQGHDVTVDYVAVLLANITN